MSFGRGGSGNIRARPVVETGSKSSPLPDITKLEDYYLLAHKAWRAHQPVGSYSIGSVLLDTDNERAPS
jgi:hypothetical protein